MNSYIKSLPNKSRRHKKHFALAVSAGVTLLIFAIWLLVKFHDNTPVVEDTAGAVNLASVSESAPSTVSDILGGIKASWEALTSVITHGGQ